MGSATCVEPVCESGSERSFKKSRVSGFLGIKPRSGFARIEKIDGTNNFAKPQLFNKDHSDSDSGFLHRLPSPDPLMTITSFDRI